LQPAANPAPLSQPPSVAPHAPPAPSPLRSSLLKKPLDAGTFGNTPPSPPSFPSRFR